MADEKMWNGFAGTKKFFGDLTIDQMNQNKGLHSNQAINSFTGVPEMITRMYKGQGIGDAFLNTFYDEVKDEAVKDASGNIVKKEGKAVMQKVGKGFRWGKLAGSVWAAGTALSAVGGAARGALTDKNGNFDIPGIPFI